MPTRTERGAGSRGATASDIRRPPPKGEISDTDFHITKRPDMTWHDHLIMLAQVGAEIEHGLMVQYLYAAYSIGGDDVPAKAWPMLKAWQKSILAIAKEEMGHLLTVQNLLTLLGGPVNLGRQNFPWDAPYYPFPLTLEPFTLDSLSCYVYAEMPSGDEIPRNRRLPPRYQEFEDKDLREVTARAHKRAVRGADVHRVGLIYKEIIEILKDETRIHDACFLETTYNIQASWDDWGRGYQPDPRVLDATGNPIEPDSGKRVRKAPPSSRDAHVRVDRMATRTEAVAAMQALSGQGEAPHLKADDTGEPSHFERFLEIYQKLEYEKRWRPSRDIAVNPTTLEDPCAGNVGDYIEDTHARHWGKLFNLRYRMLLAYLTHTFRLARTPDNGQPNLRAMVMHKVFREMYNVKTIAGILVRLPRRDRSQRRPRARTGPEFAGAPFEIPYSLRLPPSEIDAWRLHLELIGSSFARCADILPHADTDGVRYIRTLLDLDRQSEAGIVALLGSGASAVERSLA